MKYTINVELEFYAVGDPVNQIHHILRKIFNDVSHYHLLEAPRQLNEDDSRRATEDERR